MFVKNVTEPRHMFKRIALCLIAVILISSCSNDKLAFRGKTAKGITFFMTTDLHYGDNDDNNDEALGANRATIDMMNKLPGSEYPGDIPGKVARPRAVLVTGDIAEDGLAEEWQWFIADYGVNGEGRVKYPVYEGWGNHDCHQDRMFVMDGIRERNKKRAGLSNISENGYHYSWDWGNFHFIHLNIYPGTGAGDVNSWGNPADSLTFLISDLEKNVGTSGKGIFLFMHFSFDRWGLENWHLWEQDAFYNVVKDYNIITMFGGHGHELLWGKWRGIDYCEIPASQPLEGDKGFGIIHITNDKVGVTVFSNIGDWYPQYFEKDLNWGKKN
jgi:hypothetical protein